MSECFSHRWLFETVGPEGVHGVVEEPGNEQNKTNAKLGEKNDKNKEKWTKLRQKLAKLGKKWAKLRKNKIIGTS